MSGVRRIVRVGKISIGGGNRVVLIAGPCVVEGLGITLRTAAHIQKVARRLRVPFIFKCSYRKANRTSGRSFTTIGMDEALAVLQTVKSELGVPILTDIHNESEAAAAAEVADVLQIPAFLSRQTELILAAGRTGRVVNIKKGQFLAPQDMKSAIEKVASTGNKGVLVTERGASFGYHNLVVDMRSLVLMRELGVPVVLDATHSVQLPGASGNASGGEPQFIAPLARAGAAVGIDGLFVETHPNPRRARSDAASQLPLDRLESFMRQVVSIDSLVKEKLGI